MPSYSVLSHQPCTMSSTVRGSNHQSLGPDRVFFSRVSRYCITSTALRVRSQSRVPVERSGNTVFHPRFGRNHKFISSPCKEYIFIVLNVPTVIRDIGTFRATVLFLTFNNKSYWSPLPFPAHPSHFDVFQLRFDALLAPSHPTWALSMGVHQGTHLVFLCAMILHNIATRETR